MAISMTAAGAALIANKASFASVGLGSADECEAIGEFLQAAAKYPAARQPVGALIQNPNLLPE